MAGGTAFSPAHLCWPLARAGEAMEELARRAGLALPGAESLAAGDALGRATPPNTQHNPPDNPYDDVPDDVPDDTALDRWISWSARRLGLEAEATTAPMGELDTLLRGAGPALFLVAQAVAAQSAEAHGLNEVPSTRATTAGLLLLLRARGQRLWLIGPDLRVQVCARAQLRAWLCAPLEAQCRDAIERLLDTAQVSAARRPRALRAMLDEHLSAHSVGLCWQLRGGPASGFWQQLGAGHTVRKLGAMLLAFAAVYAAELAGWGVIGQITLDGRLEPGWLAAWALLVLTLVPLRLLGGWLDAAFALEVGRMLKTRLLAGILQTDLDQVRRLGAGQLLSRVMESQALESLALNGGLGVLVALLELGIAASVLASGAGGGWHLLLLAAWVALTLALSYRYFHALRRWTGQRLDMTHDLVERMVGHRTVLAQERPWRRDAADDQSLRHYLDQSRRMDRAILPAAAVLPRGWMLVGLAGLLPAFVGGNASPAALAVALGGMLLANRALSGISGGLAALSRARVAWTQVAGLLRAPVQAAVIEPFFTDAQRRGVVGHHSDGGTGDRRGKGRPSGAGTRVLEASGLGFGHGAQGQPLFRGLNLQVHQGEKILLQGPSGGGKSTLASLLVGLRRADSGLLLLNGLDHHSLGAGWHQLVTEAPQFHENHILSGSLAFNLLLGRNWPASPDDLADALELCEELGLDELLARMPSGLLQMVGETGWQLSHGERSRIFLARALLQNAQLTVLDESFAALDPQTLEKCLHCALARSSALLVIAHP